MREDSAPSRKVIDAEIFRRVMDAIADTRRASILNLSFSVEGRVVTLKGVVPAPFDRDYAIAIANRVLGVKEVVNQILVTPSTASQTPVPQPRFKT